MGLDVEKNIKIVSKATVVFVALAMILPVSIFLAGAQTSESPIENSAPVTGSFYQQNDIISLANARYDVDVGPENLPSELMLSKYDARVSGYYLVKFGGAINQAWIAELKAMGATIGSYVPYNTYMVKMDADTMAEVNSLPFVMNVDIYQPAYKIQQHMLDGVQLNAGLIAADSLDYIKYENLYQQSLAIGQKDDVTVVNIMVHHGENAHNLAAMIGKAGGNVLGITDTSVRAEVSRASVQNLAFVNNVEFITPYYENELMLADTAWTEQTKITCDPTTYPNPISTPVWAEGVTGAGIIVGVSDTGLNTDHDHFRDPSWGGASDWTGSSTSHRKVVGYYELGDNHVDFGDHGTHVCGLVAGNAAYVGSASTNKYGMAYDAKITFCDIGQTDPEVSALNDETLGGIPGDLKDLHEILYNDGATISTHSWGVSVLDINNERTYLEGTYSEDAMNTDWYMWTHKDYQVLFSAGNERGSSTAGGPDYVTTTTPPATGKNMISVAASCSGASWDDTCTFSSWGQTLDGRFKPTITATGDGLSTYQGQDSAGNDNNRDGAADTNYIGMQGTSMSSPTAAGDLALIAQYYTDGFYPALAGSPYPANGFSPSAALMKATIINGAMDAVSGSLSNGHDWVLNGHSMAYPNGDQGWGKVHLDDSLQFDGDAREMWIDDNQVGMITGQQREYKFNALAGEPLEISLVWTDFYGSAATDGALVNDLSLRVIDPLGEDYLGNNYGSTSRESDPTDPAGVDHTNVEECVLVKTPISGEWTIQIDAENIPVGPQPYALVVTGDFDDGYGWVKLDKFTYAGSDTVKVIVEDTNVATGSVNVAVTSSTGDIETVACAETATGSRVFEGTINTDILTPVSSNGALSIEDLGTITATYSDTDHDSVATAGCAVAGPAVSDVYVTDISNVGAVVHWTTNEPSTSQVFYGTTIALGSSTTLDNDMVLEHSVPITGLNAFTNYFFDVESTSIGGVTTTDTNGGTHYMFTTVDNPDVLIIQEHSDIGSSEDQVADWKLSLGYYGWSFTVWETVKFGLPTLAALNSAKLVYWDVGEGYPQLGLEERALLQTWVNQAGQQKWYQTGQDVGWDMCDPAGTDIDVNWYETYLRATFNQDDADGGGGNEISGQCYLIGSTHTISNVFPGNGGTQDLEQDIYGAGRFWPDDITNDQGGETPAPWDYNVHDGGGNAAGIAYDSTSFKVAYEAFAHAQIQDDGTFGTAGNVFGTDLNMDRATIADNTIIWLMGEDHPDIDVTYPDGGETLSGTNTVTWTCGADPSGGFEIQISTDGGQSYTVDGSAAPSARSYSWDTTTGSPKNYPNGENYKVKVMGFGTQLVGFASSDAVFTVDNGASGDDTGPVLWAGSVGGTPIPVGQGHDLRVVATADDSNKGNSNIAVMEVYIDGTSAGDKVGNMLETDGFDSPIEDGYYDYPVTASDSIGTHTVSVRAQDAAGNWGGFQTANFYVVTGPPSVDILTPTDDEIVTGNPYEITWSASDVNQAANTIDIKIEYSPDGGNAWTTLEDGTDNNDGTYSWDTTGLTDGVNYLVRISATNDAPLTEEAYSVPFSVDKTSDDEWFLQVETSSFADLDMKPVESTENTIDTAVLDTVGPVLVGTWETPTSPYTSIDGSWTFNIYGHVDVAGSLEGYLYAVVKDGTGSVLDTSILDDENINVVTSHLFTWTDTMSAGSFSATSLRVEIWLDVQVASGGSGQNTYVPTDSAFSASFWIVDNIPPEGANLNTEYPFDAADESAASISDNVRAASVNAGNNFDEIFTMCEVTVADDPATISNIDLTFEGQATAATDFQIWVYDGSWAQLGTAVSVGATTDISFTRSITANWESYIIGGVLTWGIYQTDSRDSVNVDLLEVVIDSGTPDQIFTLEYDFGTTQSSIEPTVNTGTPVFTGFDIPIPGTAGVGSWVFVSFPYVQTGNILTLLDDSIEGDGQTTWDIAKWYDPQDAADPWKTYSTVFSALNDMPTFSHTMGVWLRLATHGGDNVLTTGFTGDYSGSDVSVPLYAGWNLVGYPSDTDRPADVALSGTGADMIATYSATAPYVTDTVTLSSVTMTAGNAYWVHVDADTTWTVGI